MPRPRCGLVAQRLTLQEIAELRSVGLDTLKSQARAVYTKTSTQSRRVLERRARGVVPPLLGADGKRIH